MPGRSRSRTRGRECFDLTTTRASWSLPAKRARMADAAVRSSPRRESARVPQAPAAALHGRALGPRRGFQFPDDLWPASSTTCWLRRASRGADRAAGRGLRADLLRTGRAPHDREPASPATAKSGSSARPASSSAQAVSGRALDRAAKAGAPRKRRPKTRSPLRRGSSSPSPTRSPRRSWSDRARFARPQERQPDRLESSRCPRNAAQRRATKARQARRLLQRSSTTRPRSDDPYRRSHRAARRGRRRSRRDRAGRAADRLRLGRQAVHAETGRSTAVFSPTIDEVVRDAPCDIAVVKQGAPMRSAGSWSDSGRPHAELALQFADALPVGRGNVVACTSPRGLPSNIRTQATTALAHFIRQHADAVSSKPSSRPRTFGNAILTGRAGDIIVMGASRCRPRQRSDVPLRALPEGVRPVPRRR